MWSPVDTGGSSSGGWNGDVASVANATVRPATKIRALGIRIAGTRIADVECTQRQLVQCHRVVPSAIATVELKVLESIKLVIKAIIFKLVLSHSQVDTQSLEHTVAIGPVAIVPHVALVELDLLTIEQDRTAITKIDTRTKIINSCERKHEDGSIMVRHICRRRSLAEGLVRKVNELLHDETASA